MGNLFSGVYIPYLSDALSKVPSMVSLTLTIKIKSDLEYFVFLVIGF